MTKENIDAKKFFKDTIIFYFLLFPFSVYICSDEHLEVLRRFCNATDSPSMQSLACLILLYLLTQIVGEKLRPLAGLEVFVSSQIPFGAGLGSSAAYSVCLATGLLIVSGGINIPEDTNGVEETRRGGEIPSVLMDWINEKGISVDHSVFPSFSDSDLHLINKWGFEAEKLVHGTPSGIDNTISVFGKIMCFILCIYHFSKRSSIKLSFAMVHSSRWCHKVQEWYIYSNGKVCLQLYIVHNYTYTILVVKY